MSGKAFDGWTGLKDLRDGSALLDDAVFRVADEPPRPEQEVGLSGESRGTWDLRGWYGIRLEVQAKEGDELEWNLGLAIPPDRSGRQNNLASSQGHTRIRVPAGQTPDGWKTLTLPLVILDYPRGQGAFMKAVKEIRLSGKLTGGGAVRARNIRAVRGDIGVVECRIRSMAMDDSGEARYILKIANTTEQPGTYEVAHVRTGWEGMFVEAEPKSLQLKPGEWAEVSVKVRERKVGSAWEEGGINGGLPGGAQESHTLTVGRDGREVGSVSLITMKRLPNPFLLHQEAGWEAVKERVKTQDAARRSLDRMIASAREFQVPEVPPQGLPSDAGTPAVFKSYIEQRFWPCAVVWKLTGDRKEGEKIALLLKRLADPLTGYPRRLHANSQGIPQEGGFFAAVARSYDVIRVSDLLTDSDRQLIDETLRLYIDWNLDSAGHGGISNWSLFNLAPAAQCALVLHDMVRFNQLMDCYCGIKDHMRYGIMDDGWWYEMSLSYNLGCAEELTSLGIATRPFGIDFLNERIPTAATSKVGLRPFEFESLQGMAFGKYGPVKENFVNIKRMWDGILLYPDYRGVMFGMGDGHEHRVGGGAFELAYYAFRDPAYASVIKRGGQRSLMYSVADLPENAAEPFRQSGSSDNAGITVLRSQTQGRDISEQIQVATKYGTHGSYHGHFDRISLLSLMRHGRSFYNPETSWYGYGSYMYKWWVQTSIAHNMVVVDGKMQEPAECRNLGFFSGKMVQLTAAQTVARWSHPPYFGGYDQIEKVRSGETGYVAVPKTRPAIGQVTGFTEPVRQRRAVLVLDDYVLMFDDLKGSGEHQFDNLLHLRGATPPEGAKLIAKEPQFDNDPLSSGQFITGIRRYEADSVPVVRSVHQVGDGKNWESGGQKSLSVPGELRIEAHLLWPPKAEVVLGHYAEANGGVNKRLTWAIEGDGKALTGGTFGAWILGRGDFDVDLNGISQLKLSTSTNRGRGLNTLFWGDVKVVTTEGRELALASLKLRSKNIIAPPAATGDYDGGPVRIAGLDIDSAVPAEPQDTQQPAEVLVSLEGLNAVRLKGSVGGDWPVGDEQQIRKVVSARTRGSSAEYVTLIEPFETRRMVHRATAQGPGKAQVELKDGRIQEVEVIGLGSETGAVTVRVTESRDGKVIRQEQN